MMMIIRELDVVEYDSIPVDILTVHGGATINKSAPLHVPNMAYHDPDSIRYLKPK